VTVSVGRSATLSAAAGGSPLLRYQWYKDGAAMSGATGAGLGFASTDYSDSGTYMVVVTNSLGLTNSLGAKLAVTPAPLFANVTNGLVLHLKLDNDAQDTSGRGNHGLASGNPTFVPGRLGQALHYRTDTASSVYAYVTLNTPTDLWFSSNVNFSVAYWVRLTGTPSRLPFLSSASGAYGGNGVTFAPATGTGGWAYSLVGSGGIVNTGTGMKAINDGQWHHLVHCFDRAGQGITYLDGARVDARAVSGAGDVDFGNAFCIGQDPSGYFDQNGEADIDDIGIWRRALTEYEALSIYGAAQNGQSFDAYGPVKLLMRSSSTGLELIWQAGTLMEADNVSGPYTPVSGATAPYQKVTPGANQKFYRVQL
ncbi:MAG TPA: LamG-like jellyroll fold domain-containing protein, partial [Bacillota bacterium]|nr:LamG-like jellyroll fold domain-containing protein [Bacillota bacterium]